jgi:hypothetical protein
MNVINLTHKIIYEKNLTMAEQLLSSFASNSSESIVITKLIDIFTKSFTCDDGSISFVKRLFSGSLKALGILIIQHLVRNSGTSIFSLK